MYHELGWVFGGITAVYIRLLYSRDYTLGVPAWHYTLIRYTLVLCSAGQRGTVYYRISYLIQYDVTNNSGKQFIFSTLPSISVAFIHKGGDKLSHRKT